jgi:hypothetical protein
MSAKLQNTNKALNAFAKFVIQQSRSRLSKNKKNTSRSLYDSLDYDLKVMPNSFSLGFIMEEYGAFVDKGVSGIKMKYNTPYSYTNKKPPMQPLADWAKAKRIRLRDEKGRYKKGNYRSIGFILQRSIYEKGIKPSLFFTKPFEQAFKKLPDDLIKNFGLDIDDLLDFTT